MNHPVPIIEVRGLVNQFGTQRVHDGLNLDVYQGEIIGIVGGSGSGKSVLLRSIIGLQRPASGSIIIKGKDITRMPTQEKLDLQRLWGVLFQNGALFSSMTVVENVAFPIWEFAGVTRTEALELAEVKIEMVGLPTLARGKYPSELSGGMVKRAALARALALDPRILFLDEPTSGLDPIAAESFDQLIRELTNDLNLAVIMITHDLDSLFSICDRVAVLVDKKIRMGTLAEQLRSDHPWIREYFHGERAKALMREKA
jgi:phospholipid/cholesterol/gamma-HCH transport system ATP-binding protein